MTLFMVLTFPMLQIGFAVGLAILVADLYRIWDKAHKRDIYVKTDPLGL